MGIQADTQTGRAVNGLVCGPTEGHGALGLSRVAVCPNWGPGPLGTKGLTGGGTGTETDLLDVWSTVVLLTDGSSE